MSDCPTDRLILKHKSETLFLSEVKVFDAENKLSCLEHPNNSLPRKTLLGVAAHSSLARPS